MARLRAVARKGEVATVYLDGLIGGAKLGAPDGECMSAASFREQLARVADAPTLRVEINSDGGVVTEGMAMYNALRAFRGHKIGVVTGIAASMASVVLMACDEIRVSKGAFIMIHDPSGGASGRAADLRDAADNLEQMHSELLDIYEARTGIERGKLEKFLDAETYFTAEEAVEAGIADKVEDFEARVTLQAVARLDQAKVPAALRALATKGKVMKGKNAKIKALEEDLAKLKAMAAEDDDDEPEEETDEEESEEETDSDDDDDKDKPKDAATSALVAVVQEVTGTKNIGKATAKLAGMLSSAGAASAGDRAKQVTALIKGGKLLPSLKRWALACAPSEFKTYVASIGGSSVLKMGAMHEAPKEEPKPPVAAARSDRKSPEAIIAAQFKIPDIAKLKEAPLPACVKMPGEAR